MLNNKGFIFIEVIIIALVVSFTAMMIVNGLKTAIKSNQNSAIRTAAIHIANAQMSEIENYADINNHFPASSQTFLTDTDLNYDDCFGIDGSVKFEISQSNLETINNGNTCRVSITVKWYINDVLSDDSETITKDIWLKNQNSSQ